MKKRLFSILLALCMVLCLVPTSVFAEGETEETPVCTCETACTAEAMNTVCPVCGAEGALAESCGKYAAEESGQTGASDDAPVITAADVQALINALPEAETISADNAADVEAQLEAIDEAKVQLSDEDFAVLDFTRYDAAAAALMALSGEPGAAFTPQTANDHTHCCCGGSVTAGDHTSHSDVTYQPWNGTSSITYTNNTAYVYLTGNATLSGQLRVGNKPLVQNNTVSGKANNVYLPSGKTLTIEIGMSTGAAIGVTTANTSYPVAFSNAYGKDYANCFFADDANAHVEYQDDRKLYLVSGAVVRPLTVTFDPNGGTLADADKTRSLTTGDTYGTLPVPNYEGYDFAGWYTEQNGGTEIKENTTVTVFGTQTLYAHWTEHEYTVTVVKIGMPEWGSVTPMSTKAKAGETVTLTATPTTGNRFKEWVFLNKPEGGGWVNPVLTFTMPAEDVTVQAHFQVKYYTISYTLEGVSGGSARIVKWGDKVFKYLPQNPTYQDWVFTGWKYGDVVVTEDMTYGDLAGSDTVGSIHIIAQWHQHEFNTWTNGYPGTLKTPADCTHDAVYYWRCVCGEIEYNDNHLYEEPGTALGHLWSWTSNGNGTHTRTCRRENCNATETDNCSGGTATCTEQAVCDNCGQSYGALKPHSFTAETAEEQYLKSAATCAEKAVYYKSCAVCGTSSKGTADEATFTSGKPLGHDWGAWMPDGEGTHKRVCTHDASHVETAGCTYGDWSTNQDSHWKTCTVCGGEAERLNHADPDCNHFCDTCGIKMTEHDFTGETAITALLYKEANCLSPALYYKSCKICMLSSKGTADEATFAAGETNPDRHAEEPGDWQLDGNSHWRFYTCCHLEVDRGAHQGGTADCLAPAICEVCQHSYGELGPHHFVDQVNEYRLKSAATCTSPAVYYQSCSTCGAQGTETFTNGEPLGHDWGAWTSNGDGTHKRVCAHDAAHTETENCHGGTATCTEKAICEDCNAAYGELAAHDFTAETAEEQYLKSAATCTEKAVYYKSCAVCGLSSEGTADEATFFSGNALDHDWGAWTSNGDGTHTRTCAHDAAHTETENCHGGTATCTEKAICEDCNAAYGELAAHDFTAETAEEQYLKSAATCTEKAVYYKSCAVCGTSSKGTADEATFTSGKPLGHDYGAWTSNGDGTHTRTCTADGCSAGTQTENCIDANKDHKCDICDHIISECADDNKDHKCDYCGKKLTEHSGGKATCKDKAKCEVCGAEYGELDAKNHAAIKHFPAKAATKTAEGNIEYWYCEGCNQYFSDKDGTKEIKKADTVTAKLPQTPQTGDNSNLMLWIALLFISGGAAIAATVIVIRKKKYNR